MRSIVLHSTESASSREGSASSWTKSNHTPSICTFLHLFVVDDEASVENVVIHRHIVILASKYPFRTQKLVNDVSASF